MMPPAAVVSMMVRTLQRAVVAGRMHEDGVGAVGIMMAAHATE